MEVEKTYVYVKRVKKSKNQENFRCGHSLVTNTNNTGKAAKTGSRINKPLLSAGGLASWRGLFFTLDCSQKIPDRFDDDELFRSVYEFFFLFFNGLLPIF